jgi:uncharacterized protein (DUF58 family)
MILLPRFYYLLALAIFCALSADWLPGGLTLSATVALLLCGAVIADFIFLPVDVLKAKRTVTATAQQSQPFSVSLEMTNLSKKNIRISILDSPPVHCLPALQEADLALPPNGSALHTYSALSHRRGNFHFGPLFYRIYGPLSLIQRVQQIAVPATIQVVPDLGLKQERLLTDSDRASRFGSNLSRLGGNGQKFESLREHRQDDDWRHIDWKASAKRAQWIQRQYEFEQDQQILLLIDAGRLLGTQIGPYTKLDYSIKACLRLGQLAQKQGDPLGYAIFNDEIRTYAPPHRRPEQLAQLIRVLTHLQSSRAESDYLAVFQSLNQRLPRGSLVVCFTDLTDTASAQTLVQAARLLMAKHRLVLVTISDSPVLSLVRHSPQNEKEIYRYITASQIWADYQKAQAILRKLGTYCVDVPAESLTLATVNAYLRIKKNRTMA